VNFLYFNFLNFFEMEVSRREPELGSCPGEGLVYEKVWLNETFDKEKEKKRETKDNNENCVGTFDPARVKKIVPLFREVRPKIFNFFFFDFFFFFLKKNCADQG
jgi:hypothetical protein